MKILKPKWYNDFDPTGWWMSEKFDGVRAEWDGFGNYMSKADKLYHTHAELSKGMPIYPLSGEFWLGRGKFQETVSIVRNQRKDWDEWKDIQYLVFELPTVEDLTFEDRQSILKDSKYPFHVSIVPWHKCLSRDHFDCFYDNITERGAEGAVLAKAGSLYHFGRSGNQFKKTPTYTAEAIVEGHTEGAGKHEGRCGALMVNSSGIRFKVGIGLSDAEREDPPMIGEIITYSYKGLTNAGKPRHPAFIVVRDYE